MLEDITVRSSAKLFTMCGEDKHNLDLDASSRTFLRGNFGGTFDKGRKAFWPSLYVPI